MTQPSTEKPLKPISEIAKRQGEIMDYLLSHELIDLDEDNPPADLIQEMNELIKELERRGSEGNGPLTVE